MDPIETFIRTVLKFDLGEFLASEFVKNTIFNILFIGIILVFAGLVVKLLNKYVIVHFFERDTKFFKFNKNSAKIVQRIVKYVVYLFTFFFILQAYKIDVTGLIAVLGVSGIAVAFAAQETLANVIAGFILITDKPFNVGDRISLGSRETGKDIDKTGDVYDIGLRSTRIRTLENILVTIPNSELTKRDIYNYTLRDNTLRLNLSIQISYESNYEKAVECINKAFEESEYVLQEKENKVQIRSFADSGMELRLRAWIKNARDEREAISDILRRVKKQFDKNGIEIPYPRRYLIQDKK